MNLNPDITPWYMIGASARIYRTARRVELVEENRRSVEHNPYALTMVPTSRQHQRSRLMIWRREYVRSAP